MAAIAAGTLAIGADAAIIEPNDPKVVSIQVSIKRLPEAFNGITIAQLSDFHYNEFCAIPIRKAVEILKKLQPDMVVLTGDFVTVPLWSHFVHDRARIAASAEPCARLLRELTPPLGMFAVLGNHDVSSDYRWITEIVESNGIPMLRNRSIPIERNGETVSGWPELMMCLKEGPIWT